MRKRWIIWFGALGATILALGLLFASPSKEPFYAGRPLSFWIDQLPARIVMTNGYSDSYPGAYATLAEAQAAEAGVQRAATDARDAIRHLGSQCLPFLLVRLNTKSDYHLSGVAVGLGLRLHLLKPSSRVARSAVFVRGQALTGILELGEAARGAVPDLVVLARSKDPEVKLAARHALERLAPGELRQGGHE